jgi:hypothetical protein
VRRPFLAAAMFVVVLALGATGTRASCGAAFCPIDTHAFNLPAAGSWALDLSFQYIDQDQPRIGTRSGEVGELPSEHDEVRTINRTATLALRYAPTSRLLLGASVPWMNRFHEHLANAEEEDGTAKHEGHHHEPVREEWSLEGAGDVALEAQWLALTAGRTDLWLTGAVELPTGDDDRSNDEGEVAELPIQTGSGSTDAVLGATLRGSLRARAPRRGGMGNSASVPWFAALTYRRNGSGRDGYRLGDEWQLNAGAATPLAGPLEAVLQLNLRHRDRDEPGSSGEDPALTGGDFVFASPGLRIALREPWAAYVFVQQPLYQDVNGLQLVAGRNWLFGVQGRW